MVTPILAEVVRLPGPPRVEVAVRAVLPLHQRPVDRRAHARHLQRQHHRGHRPEDNAREDLHNATLRVGLLQDGVGQTRRGNLVGVLGRPGLLDRGGVPLSHGRLKMYDTHPNGFRFWSTAYVYAQEFAE
jgi:hypothetical protein